MPKGRNDREPINLLSLHLHPSTRQQPHHDFIHSASIFMVCGVIPPDSNRRWFVTPSQQNHKQCLLFFFFLMMSRIGTLPRGAPQKHVKNKNMITVYWGEFPAHLSSARLIALMLWWLWSPQHYDHWFHQMQRDHISNYLSSTRKIMSACTAADAAADIVTAFLWFQPNIESPLIYSQKKRKISLWGLYSTQNYS